MAIQRLGDEDLYVSVFLRDTIHKDGEIALQVHTGSEEVGDDDEAANATGDEHIGSFFDIGAAEFQECGFT